MVNDVGNKLKAARKSKDYTLEYLAEKMGVSPSTIMRYEDGHIKGIPYDKLRHLASLLGITLSYILGWEDEGEEKTGNIEELTLEEKEKVQEYIQFIKSQRK